MVWRHKQKKQESKRSGCVNMTMGVEVRNELEDKHSAHGCWIIIKKRSKRGQTQCTWQLIILEKGGREDKHSAHDSCTKIEKGAKERINMLHMAVGS